MKRRIIVLLTILLPTLSLYPRVSYAEEINLSVTGNGEGSQNEVQVQTQNETTVTQNNNSQVTNDITSNTDTGNNTASSNTGEEVTINTGSINTETIIDNTNINSNAASNQSCCQQTTNITISGNGSDSTNTVNISNVTTSNVFQTNNATLINKDTINANTGHNTASNNNGNVSIITGNITASSVIINANINNSFYKGANVLENLTAKISGNGEGSNNSINASIINDFSVILNNYFYLENISTQNLNTGYNIADGNVGDVTIKTGDIDSSVIIENVDINSNFTEIDCDGCHEEPPVCDPCDPCNSGTKPKECDNGNNPSTPPSGGGNTGGTSGGNNNSGSSSPIGAILGQMLPATGANLTIWMTLAALIMFFMGWYLRFRSGCAPGFLRV